MKRFQVAVFGKQGCDKCRLLKNRLDKILAGKIYADFEMIYYDLGTVEGLVRFCQCEMLSPQRLPSFMVFEKEDRPGTTALRQLTCREEMSDPVDKDLDIFMGLETDYTSTGTLKPKMILRILDAAVKRQEVPIRTL